MDAALVPMINIVFLLLLYFLVAGRLAANGAPRVQLPPGGGASAAAPATVLTLDAAGVSYLGARALNTDELRRHLRSLPASARRRPVQLRADARAAAGSVHRLMDACRDAGIAALELVTLDEG